MEAGLALAFRTGAGLTSTVLVAVEVQVPFEAVTV
jgi:hypothetical protein